VNVVQDYFKASFYTEVTIAFLSHLSTIFDLMQVQRENRQGRSRMELAASPVPTSREPHFAAEL